jgi:HEAT repeat protein
MRVLLAALAAASFLFAPASRTAFAHGGAYRGPAGEVPPDSRTPSDPPPPDTGGGTGTPPDTGGDTPTPPDGGTPGTPTPPDGSGDPAPPGTGGPPPASGPGGPGTRTPKIPAKKGLSYESWLFWWNHNKDLILDQCRARSGGLAATTRGALGVSVDGEGSVEEAQDLTARAVERDVVPLLVEYANDSKLHPDIQASAVLGLARLGRTERTGLLTGLARGNGDRPVDRIVEETAALSLGVLMARTPEIRTFLGGLAADPAARKRTRCFSAFALGLLGTPGQPAGSSAGGLDLLRPLVTGQDDRDVASSALVGIGLLGDPAAVPDLLAWLRTGRAGSRELNELQLSFVAAALGKIGVPGDGGAVVEAMKDQLRLRHRLVRYSAAIALGQIGPAADERTRRSCVDILASVVASAGRSTSDPQTVNFALVSLGRIAAAGADGDASRAKALDRLLVTFESKEAGRSFAALGLGLAGMGGDDVALRGIAEKVRNVCSRTSGGVEQRGAMCIALGLLRDLEAGALLANILRDKGVDPPLRGIAALSLGLLGDPAATEPVREALAENGNLRVDAATAAGLLRDDRAVTILVGILEDPKASQFALGSAAAALGRIRDQRSVQPLARILRDEAKYPPLTRALACVALGQIGDRSRVPVLARISQDVNYRAYYDAIGEVLTIL